MTEWQTDSDAWLWQTMRTKSMFPSRNDLLAWGLDQTPREGHVAEFGVWRGDSITFLRDEWRRIGGVGCVVGFDSFRGLPEPWTDVGGRVPVGHFSTNGQAPEVPGVMFLVGQYAETLPAFGKMFSGPISLAHVDCDLYSSTKAVLDFLRGRVRSGSILIFDEFTGYPEWRQHEFRALSEWDVPTEYVGCCPDGQQIAVRVA